jgi:hypothetical protein
VATFKDATGIVFSTVDIDRFTPRNDRAFVGFISKKPFIEVYLAINAGTPPQNEGVQAIKVAATTSATPAATADQPSSDESQLLP